MDRERVKFEVSVSLDPVPGAFHTKEEAEEILRAILDEIIPHYDPKVTLK